VLLIYVGINFKKKRGSEERTSLRCPLIKNLKKRGLERLEKPSKSKWSRKNKKGDFMISYTN
jgi:hypothetical protein